MAGDNIPAVDVGPWAPVNMTTCGEVAENDLVREGSVKQGRIQIASFAPKLQLELLSSPSCRVGSVGFGESEKGAKDDRRKWVEQVEGTPLTCGFCPISRSSGAGGRATLTLHSDLSFLCVAKLRVVVLPRMPKEALQSPSLLVLPHSATWPPVLLGAYPSYDASPPSNRDHRPQRILPRHQCNEPTRPGLPSFAHGLLPEKMSLNASDYLLHFLDCLTLHSMVWSVTLCKLVMLICLRVVALPFPFLHPPSPPTSSSPLSMLNNN
jgi:hypothetical protein